MWHYTTLYSIICMDRNTRHTAHYEGNTTAGCHLGAANGVRVSTDHNNLHPQWPSWDRQMPNEMCLCIQEFDINPNMVCNA